MKNIVILDGYCANPGDISWEKLERLGKLEIYERTGTDEQLIIKRIGSSEIVFTNKTPISKNVISKCKNLKFIGVLATGYNIIDTQAAKEAGIVVCNVPSYSSAATSQFAIALLLEICHHIGLHDSLVKQGEWQNSKDFCFWSKPLIQLEGKTMGIIGMGSIGTRTAITAQALGMKVLAKTRSSRNAAESETLRYASYDEIFKQSDVICLHCPLTEETKEIINKANIAKMKKGVIIINNGRGPLVNEQDVANALEEGKIYAFAADVLSSEPPKEDNPLLKAKNCILTPHISWAPKEARETLLEISAKNLEMFFKGEPQNKVN